MPRSLGVSLLTALLLGAGAVPAEAALDFKRVDGSVVRFSGTPRAWCGPWEEGVARASVHVALAGRRRHWELSVVRRDLDVGRPLRFPNEFVFNRPRGALLFVADDRNEASSAEEESSGSIVFSRASCRLGGVVAFRVSAVLGSEFFDGKPVRVSGTYRGRIGSAR